MKAGDLVEVNTLEETAIILEEANTSWHGRIHKHVKTWEVMFADGSFSSEFETDLELIDENR